MHLACTCSIAAKPWLGNVALGGRRHFSGRHFRCVCQALAHGRKNQPIVPPKTFPTAHWLQKKQRQDQPFGQGSPSRTESNFAAAIAAKVRASQIPIERVVHTGTSEDEDFEGNIFTRNFTPNKAVTAALLDRLRDHGSVNATSASPSGSSVILGWPPAAITTYCLPSAPSM